MSVVCGADFSEYSSHAVAAAARIAARLDQTVHLVHALEFGSIEDRELRDAELAAAKRRLDGLAQRVRERGAAVETHIDSGSPDEVLLAAAARVSAKLIVVAAMGRPHKGAVQLGGHAERLAQRAQRPVLIVRDAEPFESWARGARPLRIVLGADATQSSERAMQWIEGLRAIGPCDVTAVHLYWPPQEFERLGLGGIRSYLEPDPLVTAALEQALAARLTAGGMQRPTIRSLPHMGRVGDRLAAIAREDGADLIVVGTHARGALERIAEGSVSSDVLHRADVAVACIPVVPTPELARVAPPRQIVVATDFSEYGNAAVPLAYAIAPAGCTLHLVHVVPDPGSRPDKPHDIFSAPEAHAAERAQLARLGASIEPDRAPAKVHVLESNDAAAAITQAAERLDADVICLGTRGLGLSAALLGSVAQAVVRGTHRPVLLARKPRA